MGLSIQELEDVSLQEKSYTFIGHNQKSIPLLPFGFGMKFPDF